MKYRSLSPTIVTLWLLMLGASGTVAAQQVTVTTPQAITIVGGDYRNHAGSISFSGGEVAVQTSVARAITVVNVTESFKEGVQQPLTERDASTNSITAALDVEVSLYPNPATDGVTLESSNTGTPLHYSLYDAQGRRLQEGIHNGGAQRIDLTGYATGTYMLRVASDNEKQANIYKIILAK